METTVLGEHRLAVVPQRHARLRHLLTGEDLQAVLGAEYSKHAYRVLCVLIPTLEKEMPEWEFDGYGSEEAWKEQDYDETLDKSPTVDQIVEAFEIAIKVSGGNRLGKLLGLVQSVQKMTDQAEAEANAASTPPSPDSPGNDGESPTPSTGAPSPTPIES